MNQLVAVLALLACNAAQIACAAVPAELHPLVVEAPFSFFVREFDLTKAFEKAKAQDKPMFIYLDARDCPPCQEYSKFLSANLERLKPHFEKVVLVDIRTTLRGSTLSFRIRDRNYSFEEFKSLVGDSNIELSYPYFWLISPAGHQVRQLPRGSSNYTEVEKHIEILKTR